MVDIKTRLPTESYRKKEACINQKFSVDITGIVWMMGYGLIGLLGYWLNFMLEGVYRSLASWDTWFIYH